MDFKDNEINDLSHIENDEGTLVDLNFKWFDLNELKDVNLKPTYLKDLLLKDEIAFNHYIIKD